MVVGSVMLILQGIMPQMQLQGSKSGVTVPKLVSTKLTMKIIRYVSCVF